MLIERLLEKNGPDREDYLTLHTEIQTISKQNFKVKQKDLLNLLSPVLTTDTMQGFAFQKPHGYSGDFEIIDRIYTKWKTEDKSLSKWDDFFHFQEAPIAVRNRKKYFIDQLSTIQKKSKKIHVLNMASGPGRDMLEFFQACPNSKICFDCVDMDKNAIQYAQSLCSPYLDNITFFNENVFKFIPTKKYDVIWSAGLFDYLDDKQFAYLLSKFCSWLKTNGEAIVGNFSNNNPSRGYMEVFGKWFLNHRDGRELIELAINAGIENDKIKVFSEDLGVNLFLHIRK